jgi:hypothetical protein
MAAINREIPKGILSPKIMAVGIVPSSAFPEVNSNTEPTAAIKAMQEMPRKAELLGVTGCSLLSKQ